MKKVLMLAAIAVSAVMSLAQESAEDYFEPLKYRNIGPFRGGRSVSSCGVVGDPMTYYMGTTGGGLWKTEDGGQRWKNISDKYFKTGSVGAVAVSESHPYTVYCGMGEHAPRGVMTSYGDGVYKSTDAGKTWKHVGLAATQHIARIVIHPTDPDVVYVAAQGALYGPNKERGIYKSTDGGATWRQVLFVNELSGCSELSLDMNFPDRLYATMWEHQRKPWKVISGGEGSGVYASVDGGETWKKIEEGLPEEKGKMAISVCRSNPDKLYLLMESDSEKDKGGLFASYNGGKKWSRVSGDNRLTQRAWYYTEVFTDPLDENTLYVLSAPALKSIDGGRSWSRIRGTHGDFHDLWINPHDSKNMIISNDGGGAVSYNGGSSWSPQDIMPTAQFYRINVDNLWPYNIYGGQQDNSTIKIASASVGSGSIGPSDWTYSAGGESAFLAFDPDNPRYVMGGSYLGTISILDMESKSSVGVMAAPLQYLGKAARDMKYLYNWNAPIIWSQHEPGTFYHCAQLVLRTRDMGENWEEVSPDLTRNIDERQGKGGGPYTNEAVGAENYGTISYMVESPHEKGVFYTGSDDGLVHVTHNGGETWENVTPKKLEQCLVNAIEVSPHDPATAYIATTRYKFNDHTPALYKTTDYGKSWVNISEGIPQGAYTRVVREDQERKDLLYAGTELGVFVSWDGGQKWESLQLNLPVTPINDLKVHQGDLIVATSGRSFWILDDLNLLAQYQPTEKLELYEAKDTHLPAWYSSMNSTSKNFTGMGTFDGLNPASGLLFYYNLPAKMDSASLKLEIFDSMDSLVVAFSPKKNKKYRRWDGGPPPTAVLPADTGLNRFAWNMKHKTMPGIPGVYIEANYRGHEVIPGEYKVRLSMGDNVDSTMVSILSNPRYEIELGQYEKYDAIMTQLEDTLTLMHNTVNQLKDATNQLGGLLKLVKEDSVLTKEIKTLIKDMTAWDKKMVQRKSKAYDDVENFENGFTADYMYLINQTSNDLARVNQANRDLQAEFDAQWAEYRKEADAWVNETIPALNEKLWAAGIGAIRLKKTSRER